MRHDDTLQRLKDYLGYSRAYLKASELLSDHSGSLAEYPDPNDLPARVFRNVPVFNNLGLAAELAFKTAILATGHEPPLTHGLIKLFEHVEKRRDVINLRNRAKEAAIIVGPPDGMLNRMAEAGQSHWLWFEWDTQLGTLNDNYETFRTSNCSKPNRKDARFRTRYPSPQRNFREICVPAIIAGLCQLLDELHVDIAALEKKR